MKFKKAFVPFILWYLKIWAKLHLFKIRPKIIGVGGASGKTSLSHFLYIIISERNEIRESSGKNSQTGIPLSILGLSLIDYTVFDWLRVLILAPVKALFDFKGYEIFIAELGIDSPFPPNNMSYLLKIVKPQIGALTNIAFEHSENFDKLVSGLKNRERENKVLDLTAEEEELLLTALPKNGIAILNIDDPKIRELKGKIKANILTVSTKDKNAHFFGKASLETGFKLEIIRENQRYTFSLPNPIPTHYGASILEALAISESLGIPLDSSIKILRKNFSLPASRFSIFRGIKGTKILDSSYNSSLIPALDALLVLSKMKAKRKVAIMGDMRELGSMSKTQHEKLALKLLATDMTILIGPLMKEFVAPILKKNNHNFYSFLTFSQSKNVIKKVINSGDAVLVKGSQNTLYLERVVEMLLLNKKDKNKLCRRGKFWDRMRKETP